MRVRWVVAVAAAALLAGCTNPDADDAETNDVGNENADAAQLSHIHGLGVSDGNLYVATHHGLFTVSDDGEAQLASEEDHDFMGFTVVDDGTFLASGHPGSSTDLPGNLGLLESTDGGATWSSLSLMGEVDFHALDATGDAVYGYDSASGQLLASSDRTSWEGRGEVPIADVAINPTDSAVVVITTEAGPQISVDGGTSFEVLDGAPLLMLVDWPQVEDLVGITPDGVVYRSTDGGSTWAEHGDVGDRPHAMTVGMDGTLYVAIEHAIVASSDGGDTFTVWFELG